MKGEKDCWNCACICWICDSETSNCMTEDIEPQDCDLSDIDLRAIVSIADIEKIPRRRKIIAVDKSDDNTPDRVSFYYMHDNHTFSPLGGYTLDEIVYCCNKIRANSPCGMLCPPILLKGDREIRRVGEPVHCQGLEKSEQWFLDIARWKEEIKKDADVMRLLRA